MKLYRTRTQEEYDWLMQTLEDEGCEWRDSKDKPTNQKHEDYKEVIYVKGNTLSHSDHYYATQEHYNKPIIEVSDLMNTKFKVGDKVRVRNDLRLVKYVTMHHIKMIGNKLTIDFATPSGIYTTKETGGRIYWTDEMLEPIVDPLAQKVMERNNKPESLKELTEPLDLIASHKRVCEHLNKVYADKNHDYGNSFGETYEKLGAISAVTRISDKTSRLQSLVTKDEQRVDDERLIDTALDLANYAIMFAMELEETE